MSNQHVLWQGRSLVDLDDEAMGRELDRRMGIRRPGEPVVKADGSRVSFRTLGAEEACAELARRSRLEADHGR